MIPITCFKLTAVYWIGNLFLQFHPSKYLILDCSSQRNIMCYDDIPVHQHWIRNWRSSTRVYYSMVSWDTLCCHGLHIETMISRILALLPSMVIILSLTNALC